VVDAYGRASPHFACRRSAAFLLFLCQLLAGNGPLNREALARADIIASYGRSCAEHKLLERLGMAAMDQTPAAPPASADGSEGAGEEDFAGDIEEAAPAAFDAIVEGVVNGDDDE